MEKRIKKNRNRMERRESKSMERKGKDWKGKIR